MPAYSRKSTVPTRQHSDPVTHRILVECGDLAFHPSSSHPLLERMHLSPGRLGQPSSLSGPSRVGTPCHIANDGSWAEHVACSTEQKDNGEPHGNAQRRHREHLQAIPRDARGHDLTVAGLMAGTQAFQRRIMPSLVRPPPALKRGKMRTHERGAHAMSVFWDGDGGCPHPAAALKRITVRGETRCGNRNADAR